MQKGNRWKSKSKSKSNETNKPQKTEYQKCKMGLREWGHTDVDTQGRDG